jgi:hypothetical protein
MGPIPVAALVPIGVFVVLWVGYCWYDISRREVKSLPKWGWRLVCLLSVPVGGAVYMLWGREES